MGALLDRPRGSAGRFGRRSLDRSMIFDSRFAIARGRSSRAGCGDPAPPDGRQSTSPLDRIASVFAAETVTLDASYGGHTRWLRFLQHGAGPLPAMWGYTN